MENKIRIKEERKKIVEGLERSYQKLVEFKRYKKSPLVIERHGEIIEIAPDNIPPKAQYLYNGGL